MDNATLFEAPYEEPFYTAAKEVLRSTQSSSHRRQLLLNALRTPTKRAWRGVAGTFYHSLRLPWVRYQMAQKVIPNPRALRV